MRCLPRAPSLLVAAFLLSAPASGQHQQISPVPAESVLLILDGARRIIRQRERNIVTQRIGLAEFELRARKIQRQLEALASLTPDEIAPGLREYTSQKRRELANLRRHIGAMTSLIETEEGQIEEQRRQLREKEGVVGIAQDLVDGSSSSAARMGHESRVGPSARKTDGSQPDWQSRVALQNLRLIESEKNRPAIPLAHRGFFKSSIRGQIDGTEADLCKLLEDRASDEAYDIAEINLLAARGLPGAEDLDIDRTLKIFDLWAAWVNHETLRHLYRFEDAPEKYGHSEGYFRMLMMVSVLQQDFRVCYHKDPKMRAGPVEILPSDFTFFSEPEDLFVHGLTAAEHQGTCASLPVFYVAIGRRLGYPLKLATCKGHLFARWEDETERFNMEATNRGLNCYPDDEYREWPWPISEEELKTGMYLQSLSPKRELAEFLELRSLCLKHHGLEQRHATVKYHADRLRREEGVDVDRLNSLMRQSRSQAQDDRDDTSPLLYQVLTNTNSWRTPENRRGANGKRPVLAIERLDTE